MNFQVENIEYKRKTVDRGIVLGERRSIFDLSERKHPCKAKHAGINRLVSKRSPQKSNFTIFIPADHLTPGMSFTVLNRDYTDKHPSETTYRVLDLTAYFVTCEVIQAGKPQLRVNKALQRRINACKTYTQTEPIAKEDAWFVANPESWVDDFPASSREAEPCKQTLKDAPAVLPEKNALKDLPPKADHSCSMTDDTATGSFFPVLPRIYRRPVSATKNGQSNNINHAIGGTGMAAANMRLARKFRPRHPARPVIAAGGIMKHTFKISAYPYSEGTEEYHFEITTEAEEMSVAKGLVEALLEGTWEIEINA